MLSIITCLHTGSSPLPSWLSSALCRQDRNSRPHPWVWSLSTFTFSAISLAVDQAGQSTTTGPSPCTSGSGTGNGISPPGENSVIGLAVTLAGLGFALVLGRTPVELLSVRWDQRVTQTIRTRFLGKRSVPRSEL